MHLLIKFNLIYILQKKKHTIITYICEYTLLFYHVRTQSIWDLLIKFSLSTWFIIFISHCNKNNDFKFSLTIVNLYHVFNSFGFGNYLLPVICVRGRSVNIYTLSTIPCIVNNTYCNQWLYAMRMIDIHYIILLYYTKYRTYLPIRSHQWYRFDLNLHTHSLNWFKKWKANMYQNK